MATLSTFSSLLNDYIFYDVLSEEQKRQNWLLGQVSTDDNWKGGPLIVFFEASEGSTITHGAMASEDDITEFEYCRGSVDMYKEAWGALKWNAKDLWENVPASARKQGYVNKQSFLRNLLGQQKKFTEHMKEAVSIQLLSGGAFATLTADATANDGLAYVNHPERMKRGMKVIMDDDNSSAQTMWVKTIDVNNSKVLFVTTKGGSTPFDFSAAPMTVDQNAKCYREGAETSTNNFTSLRSQLLSAANGGSANLFGKSKLEYPFLQSINVSGASVTSTNVLESIFDGWTRIKQLGKGNASDVILSYIWLGHIMKALEAGSGGYRHISTKVSAFGYTEITIQGVEGLLKVVGVQEADDDIFIYMDWDALKFHTNGMFEVHQDPEGKQYYTVRATTGYKYIVDIRCFGELVLNTPAWCGIMYGIPLPS